MLSSLPGAIVAHHLAEEEHQNTPVCLERRFGFGFGFAIVGVGAGGWHPSRWNTFSVSSKSASLCRCCPLERFRRPRPWPATILVLLFFLALLLKDFVSPSCLLYAVSYGSLALVYPFFLAKRLRNMIIPHMSGGRAPPESGLGAKPPYGGVTIAILGDYGGPVYMYSGSGTVPLHVATRDPYTDSFASTGSDVYQKILVFHAYAR
eukprot:COSAG05_NODE_3230_length_2221_cov_2428.137931_4_plen_206_part_00